MQYNESGTVTVRVYTAGGALPVANSVVRIIGADEDNRFIEYSVITDIDGITKALILPSPAKAYSLAPHAKEIPYAVYDLEITADGYYTKRINNIAVFSGIEAIQEVNMIPISPLQDAIFPRGNLEATVRENEYL